MKKDKNKEKGDIGEEIASNFLKNKGYNILARNIATKYGEIDIIAEYCEVLIFVEVKSLFSESDYDPEDNFNFKKRKNFKRTINFLIEKGDVLGALKKDYQEIRADLVVLTKTNNYFVIKHYENIEI
ncbi:MAG: YraN family protein [Anaplasmataceae bacterium]|nr:YraN family protein [Anaplasmataceae bacterium]